MTKAKMTENGNVKVTMSLEQFCLIYELLELVRLGPGDGKNAAYSFLEDLHEFTTGEQFDTTESQYNYGVTIGDNSTKMKENFSIEVLDK